MVSKVSLSVDSAIFCSFFLQISNKFEIQIIHCNFFVAFITLLFAGNRVSMYKMLVVGLPWSQMITTPHFNAGDTGLIPGRETKIPHFLK